MRRAINLVGAAALTAVQLASPVLAASQDGKAARPDRAGNTPATAQAKPARPAPAS